MLSRVDADTLLRYYADIAGARCDTAAMLRPLMPLVCCLLDAVDASHSAMFRCHMLILLLLLLARRVAAVYCRYALSRAFRCHKKNISSIYTGIAESRAFFD